MFAFRCLLLVALAVVAVSAYPKTECGDEARHNLILGEKHFADWQMYEGYESMNMSTAQVKTKDFVWPLPGHRSTTPITRVEVYDVHKDGSGGCAFLTQGGVGSPNVTLHLKTQRGGSYDFYIAIYSDHD